MKKMLPCTALVLLAFSFAGTAQNKKQSLWPPNATLTVYEGPGMRPEWSRIIISDTACWYTSGGDGPELANRFTLKKTVLDTLMKFLMDHQFDQMQQHQRIALWYDKGTTSISLVTDKESYYAAESHSMDLEDAWRNRFHDILNFVYGLGAKAEK